MSTDGMAVVHAAKNNNKTRESSESFEEDPFTGRYACKLLQKSIYNRRPQALLKRSRTCPRNNQEEGSHKFQLHTGSIKRQNSVTTLNKFCSFCHPEKQSRRGRGRMQGAAHLVSDVGQLVGNEYRQLRGIAGKVAELSDELATMNAILRMHSEAEEGAVDHFIREWVRQVSELYYDAEDCVHLYTFRIRCRPRDRFIVWSKQMVATLFPRRRLAREIRALYARAVVISERHARYSFSRPPPSSSRVLVVATPAHALRPADDPHQFVGIKEQAEILAKKLKVVSDKEFDTEQLQVFSIVGFGGLGKTTLAMEMCRQLEADFQRQAQVSVSQTFDGSKDLKGLLKRVLQQIIKPKIGSGTEQDTKAKVEDPLGDIEKMDLDGLAKKLKELLTNTRYLIVIDDVWTITAWESIQSQLPKNKCGIRIIVTTRIETVAKACSRASVYSDYIYHIKALESTDSKKLFLSRAFGSMNASCPTNLEKAMDKILKKCGGLPLAIVSIASLLANYNSSEGSVMWWKVCNSIGSMMDNNPTLEGMRQILTLSYNHLPHYLKDCMMYLCIFPEDYEFSKTRLLRRWIAEGLVIARRGQTMMEVAEDYFDELVSRNMIEQVAYVISFHDRLETCRVHDMMFEIAVSKSLEANFVSLVGGQYEGMLYDKIRRLSVHPGAGRTTKVDDSLSKEKTVRRNRRTDVDEMKVQHVRSLSMFELEPHKLLDRLGEFTLLRVLDMEDCKGVANKHMKDICKMYLLKFLSLKGTDISLMPPEVGDLEHLLTLDLEQTRLDDLPETMRNVEKLECLKFNKKDVQWWVMWKPPRGVSNMKALRDVDRLLVGDVEIAKELGELEQLQRIFVYVVDNPQQEDVRQQLALSLSKMCSLRWLNLGDMKNEGMTMDYLINLESPPMLLRHLRFAGGFTKLPEWVGSLTYLVEFTLSWAQLKDGQLLDVLCQLPDLKRIMFQHIFYVGTKLVVCNKHKFPALKDMIVDSSRQYPEVYKFEEGSMTELEKLTVSFDKWESKRIVGVEHLKKLKEVKLTGTLLESGVLD
ncbi:disease resistance protein Pik-2-like [Triticum dicoccoides]|uniref:disease resistance protein Pik-2-like n=1 Tax=Triticum dicoccoides TaxID=85692 RepID=UPI00188E46B1|nr:disease resistance protein Pik-2-like [Triticum dicoccoides]